MDIAHHDRKAAQIKGGVVGGVKVNVVVTGAVHLGELYFVLLFFHSCNGTSAPPTQNLY